MRYVTFEQAAEQIAKALKNPYSTTQLYQDINNSALAFAFRSEYAEDGLFYPEYDQITEFDPHSGNQEEVDFLYVKSTPEEARDIQLGEGDTSFTCWRGAEQAIRRDQMVITESELNRFIVECKKETRRKQRSKRGESLRTQQKYDAIDDLLELIEIEAIRKNLQFSRDCIPMNKTLFAEKLKKRNPSLFAGNKVKTIKDDYLKGYVKFQRGRKTEERNLWDNLLDIL